MKAILAISTLTSTIIGVGLFALPYVTLKVGFWTILAYFSVLTPLVILIHLFFGELALETQDFKRLPGFAKVYLGKWGQILSYISTIFGIFGALLAYLIVGGDFLGELLSPIFGGNSLVYTLFYFILGAALIIFGTKAIIKVEFWSLILIFVILLVIFWRGFSFINSDNLFIGNWKSGIENLFLPYGIILFSLWGAALIPEIEETLGKKRKSLKWIIFISILISAIVYIFFIYLILGIAGSKVTESALGGVKFILGDGIVSLLIFFGLVTTFTSFIALGLTLKKIFWYDLKLEKKLASFLTCFIPLTLFLIGLKKFITVISFVGGIMLGIDGILILLMYREHLKTQIPKIKFFLLYFLILILLLGIIYEITYYFIY